MSKKQPRKPHNIKFLPYSLWETVKWIGKHIIMDFYVPFTIIIIFLFVTPVVAALFNAVPPLWLLFFLILFGFFVSLVIHQTVQIKQHKIENIGTLNEDGWREFEFINDDDVNQKTKGEVKYRIGFIGDIMKMDDYDLKFEKRIQKFFGDVNLIVGNLEGIILTDKYLTDNHLTEKDVIKKGGLASQMHKEDILKQLKRMVSTEREMETKWLLSVSNNHSADYGGVVFKYSRDHINDTPNYYAFGDLDINHSAFPWDDSQSMKELDMGDINIVAGTMWTNKNCDNLITRFKSITANPLYKPEKFNICFPHWHYENESYVRSKIQRKTIHFFLKGEYIKTKWNMIYNLLEFFSKKEIIRAWFQRNTPFLFNKPYKKSEEEPKQKWDLIFGHHSHVPQPITDYGRGILCYSGGNFTSSERRKKHISGLIMKCEICKSNYLDKLELGKVQWCYTRNERKKKEKKVRVVIDCLRTNKNYFERRSIKFRTTLILFSIAIGIWLSMFWVLGEIHILYWLIYIILIIALIVYFGVKYSKFRKRRFTI